MIRDTFFKLCASVRARSFSSLVFWCTCVYVCVCVCACVCVCVWSSVRVFLSNGVRAVCGRMKGRGGGVQGTYKPSEYQGSRGLSSNIHNERERAR